MAQRTQGNARRRRRKTRKVRRARIPAALLILCVLVSVAGVVELVRAVNMVFGSNVQPVAETARQTTPATESSVPTDGSHRVTFCAVGDNLINEGGEYTVDLLGMADDWAGTVGDGEYDFSPLYANVRQAVSSADIALVNQETTLGGNDEFEYMGFPSYNTPDEVADAVAACGFDVVNCATNHTYDLWVDAIEHSLGVWARQDAVKVIGSYVSEQDRSNIRVIEKDGIRIAFLAYCYGQNGYEQQDLPNDYYAAPIDRTKMREEVLAARTIADAVVVYLHWGEEMSHDITDEQQELASYVAGLGVDLLIGSHAHVIQPVAYISRGIPTTTGKEATSSQGMLCVYGLGDFVSGYTLPEAILSGMFTCDFVLDKDGTVSIERPSWHALVEHAEEGVDTVYALSDYTPELAERNQLLARVEDEYGYADKIEWARQTTRDVIGNAVQLYL